MSNSAKPGVCKVEDFFTPPPRTPGPVGWCDAGDPFAEDYGDTPGPLGRNDDADPNMCVDDGISLAPEDKSTNGLPAPNPNAPKLTDADYENAAKEFGVEVAVIHAVATVESGGRSGFDDKGRPKILFEAQWFHKFTKGKYDKDYPELSQPTWEQGKQYYKLDQWERLEKAMQLDREAALKSASWGVFQVMGFNHNGFDDVDTFARAMFASEAQHLKTFLAFCRDNKLISKMESKDWAGFAKSYNGPGYKDNKYDEKLRDAYDKYVKEHTPSPPEVKKTVLP